MSSAIEQVIENIRIPELCYKDKLEKTRMYKVIEEYQEKGKEHDVDKENKGITEKEVDIGLITPEATPTPELIMAPKAAPAPEPRVQAP